MSQVWLNVYEVTRHYGGSEEGGWWYDNRKCLVSYGPFASEEMADATYEWLVNKYEGGFQHQRNGGMGRYSVMGGADVVIDAEREPGRDKSGWMPYE